jgi:hypothetical protein
MASQLLLDSNAYFRLARVIRPFLGQQFGDPPYAMFVIAALDEEFEKSSRLNNKFHWVGEPEYKINRNENCLGKSIDTFTMTQTVRFMKDHKYHRSLGVSKVDIAVLAVAYNLGIAIVSDDIDVQEMAKDFEMHECMTSLEVLQWLHGEGILSLKTVKATVQLWRYEKDLPLSESEFIEEFYAFFEEQPW